MHLLPVADCEWSTIDIMRGSEQHTCMCELAAATHICSTLRAYFYHSIANALSLIQNASYPQYDGLSLWAGKNRSTMGSRCFFLFSLLGSELLHFASLNMFSWVYAYICVCERVRGCAHECLRVCVCVWVRVDWRLRTAHIFCLNAVSSACAPFIQVWQIKSCFSSVLLRLPCSKHEGRRCTASTCSVTSDCHVWAAELRAAGTSSAASRLSSAAALPAVHMLNSPQQSQAKIED